ADLPRGMVVLLDRLSVQAVELDAARDHVRPELANALASFDHILPGREDDCLLSIKLCDGVRIVGVVRGAELPVYGLDCGLNGGRMGRRCQYNRHDRERN